MTFEVVEHNGLRYAEILYKDTTNESTKFYSEANAALQLGLMSHPSGFVETPHSHPEVARESTPTQQAFIVISGKVIVDFFDDLGNIISEIHLSQSDAILIIQGVHRIRVTESSRCITIKQGPFVASLDKIESIF
jgi:hypothetical protein